MSNQKEIEPGPQFIEGKTVVEVTDNNPEWDIKVGQIGYIDGYVQGGNGTPCAVVIVPGGTLSLVPTYMLKPIYLNP